MSEGDKFSKFAGPNGAKSHLWAHFGFLVDKDQKHINDKQVPASTARMQGYTVTHLLPIWAIP